MIGDWPHELLEVVSRRGVFLFCELVKETAAHVSILRGRFC